ncbi:MAG: MFS transporter [Chromatiales bacterium]|nr:MAG: MFS transporter [Chromatiales bacterium]
MSVEPNIPPNSQRFRQIPKGVWALGFVSLFMDISSEMVHSLLPVFFVSVIGLSYTSVGLIEGIAQAIALITKIFSGALSDLIGKRKPLALLGYGLAAVTKPIFALASSAGLIVSARFLDRVGKGIRGAPRDALIADITPEAVRGASYGIRQSLDSVGAFVGPGLALMLMFLLANDIRGVFWFAVIPAAISVLILWFGVREPKRPPDGPRPRLPLHRSEIRKLSKSYWNTVAVGAVLMLAGFSEAFLVLRAQDIGLPVALIPVVFIVMNVIYALSAYPAGMLSDRWGRPSLIVAGFLVLIVADAVLALAGNITWVMTGVVLWGLYMGLTQGVVTALVADTAPAELRGTAFGVFNLVSGISLLLASAIAGWLWDQYGAPAPFIASAAFAAVALAGWFLRSQNNSQSGAASP